MPSSFSEFSKHADHLDEPNTNKKVNGSKADSQTNNDRKEQETLKRDFGKNMNNPHISNRERSQNRNQQQTSRL